ncbi:MAG: NAD(P)H-dependent oxidoreductase subunit E, partial [Lentisphaeria bacterium]|nr:NAD(P)H-dependent oxidoreductase subunit E [Lentisphaeria bacterium]
MNPKEPIQSSDETLPVRMEDVDAIVKSVGTEKHNLIHILHGIQEKYRYLPRPALRRVCQVTDITPSQINGVSTFFKQFRHEPVGKNIVKVCVGTACHVSGAMNIHESICEALEIPDERRLDDLITDAQNLFTIEKVACIGCCTLAPVIQSERDTYGPLSKTDC